MAAKKKVPAHGGKPYRVRREPQGKGPHRGPHLDTQDRINEIIQARLDGTFRFGVTLREFAAKWGVGYDHVKELSAQATRQILKDRARSDVRSYVHITLERVVEQAFDDGNLGAVTQAVKLLIDLRGLAAPKKTEVTGKDGGPVELDVEMAGAAERVSRAIDRLAAARGAPGAPPGAGTDAG